MSDFNNNNLLIPGIGDDENTLRRIFVIIVVSIISLIYLPICLFGVYQFYKHKDYIYMRKRYQWITVFMIINLILSLIFLPILLIGYANYYKLSELSIDLLLYIVIVLAINIGWKQLWRIWMVYFDINYAYSIANKEWKILINNNIYNKDDDDNDADIKEKWFMKNKSTYGKWGYFSIPYFVIVFVDFFLITLWEYALPKNLEEYKSIFIIITIVTIASIPISTVFYLRLKTPKFDDNFAIRDETKNMILSILIGILFIAILVITGIVLTTSLNEQQTRQLTIVTTILCYFIWASIYTLVTYFTTIYPVIKNKEEWGNMKYILTQDKKDDIMILHRTKTMSRHKSSSFGSRVSDIMQNGDKKLLSLLNILNNENAFNVFMIHLSQEFSTEIILSIVEMDQFQRELLRYFCSKKGFDFKTVLKEYETYYQSQHRETYGSMSATKPMHVAQNSPDSRTAINENEEDDENGVSFNIPPKLNLDDWKLELYYVYLTNSIPLSCIVHSDLIETFPKYRDVLDLYKDDEEKQKLVEFRIRAYEIYKKYIEESSVYEINISSRARGKLTVKMRNFDEYVNGNFNENIDVDLLDCFRSFSPSLRQMYQLLTYSYTRFKKNAAYTRLCETIELEIK